MNYLPRPMLRRLASALFVASLLAACGPTTPAGPKERQPGERAPLSAPCETLDGTRCLLPWPSNTYTVADATTRTGLELALTPRALPVFDSVAALNRADGFSVVTPLAVGFPTRVDHRLMDVKRATEFRLFSEVDGADAEVPLRLSVVEDSESPAGLLLAYPMRPLKPETDYVAVVLDSVKADDGSALEATPAMRVALGLTKATTEAEGALWASHGPTRRVLSRHGLEAAHVLRAWSFTTRSSDGVARPLAVVRAAAFAAVDAGAVSFVIDSAAPLGSALDVRGRATGLPSFIEADGGVLLDADGFPRPSTTHDAPFRVVLPPGTGDYPVVVFGHGTGGSVNDTTFDADIVAAGGAKLNLMWAGWTDTSAVDTLVSLERPFSGTARSTSRLLQSLADAAALEAALPGAFGTLLAAPTLGGQANPAAGRRPDASKLVYAGGSLGGTMGYVHALADPNLHAAVLNVPGGAWTHFVPSSSLWETLSLVFHGTTPSTLNQALGIALTQGNWDPIDGAAWAAFTHRTDTLFLVQESVGDPILPNIGSEMVAVSSGAVQLGGVIEPVLGVAPVAGPVHQTAYTQFRVPASVSSDYGIHGFGAGSSPAGIAAREQIRAFITSVWSGAPAIAVPPSCASRANQSCDFAAR